MKYIDGALRYNNPVRILYDEAKSEWPGRSIACIISIGTISPVKKEGGDPVIHFPSLYSKQD